MHSGKAILVSEVSIEYVECSIVGVVKDFTATDHQTSLNVYCGTALHQWWLPGLLVTSIPGSKGHLQATTTPGNKTVLMQEQKLNVNKALT